MLAHGATWVNFNEFKSRSGKTTTVVHGITAMCCLEKKQMQNRMVATKERRKANREEIYKRTSLSIGLATM